MTKSVGLSSSNAMAKYVMVFKDLKDRCLQASERQMISLRDPYSNVYTVWGCYVVTVVKVTKKIIFCSCTRENGATENKPWAKVLGSDGPSQFRKHHSLEN